MYAMLNQLPAAFIFERLSYLVGQFSKIHLKLRHFKVILLRSLRFSVTVFPLRGYLVLSQRSHQFLLGLGFNRRALRVRLVTVVKRNSSSGSTRPFGWRFMKWTSCCLCVVREPFLGRPFRLKPRYHPLYLADTRAV
ncbi:hypothetical protein GOODEAATRI_014401 [Goodea atripinnis]|uniref:Uncharacterized protein n=1 Tax=Goodea atripinnis TaxID=208336 RepID=A0ABV0NKA7_9TELE